MLHGKLKEWAEGWDDAHDVFNTQPLPLIEEPPRPTGRPRPKFRIRVDNKVTKQIRDMVDQVKQLEWQGPKKYGRPFVPEVQVAYIVCKCGEHTLSADSMYLHSQTCDADPELSLFIYEEDEVNQIRFDKNLAQQAANRRA
jgi:hypothetical protein